MKAQKDRDEASPATGARNFVSPTVALALASLFWLSIGVPFLSLYREGVRPFFTPGIGNQDIPAYYMAGTLAATGDFSSLYPIPRETIDRNAGWAQASDLKPGYLRIMEQRGVPDSHRFNLPPPSAWLFAPMGALSYGFARWAWLAIMGACCWGLCLWGYRQGRSLGLSRTTGWLAWAFWAFSPIFVKTLRTGNATPAAALALIWRRRTRIAVRKETQIAAVVLLLGVYLVFSPYCWEHYVVHYIPFLGVLWGAADRTGRGLVLAGSILLWLPLGALRGGSLIAWEPLRSHMLLGQALLISAAVQGLALRSHKHAGAISGGGRSGNRGGTVG